jgi:cell fate (sporulation/competence/biofilm development) regulator YlbF (YheA/YmcA/DUF963 family)
MDTSHENLSPQMLSATEALAVNLRQSEPFLKYYQAQARLEADAPARDLLKRLAATQSEIRRLQTRGEIAPGDIEKLRNVQGAVQANAIIVEYSRTQQSAIAYLRTINQDISQLLNIDYAALAKRPGCC